MTMKLFRWFLFFTNSFSISFKLISRVGRIRMHWLQYKEAWLAPDQDDRERSSSFELGYDSKRMSYFVLYASIHFAACMHHPKRPSLRHQKLTELLDLFWFYIHWPRHALAIGQKPDTDFIIRTL